MKNYDNLSAQIFDTNIDEINTLVRIHMNMEMYNDNLSRVREFLGRKGYSVVEFSLRMVPENWKRNNWDSAKLLVFRTQNGNYYAKRFNNSQWLNVES